MTQGFREEFKTVHILVNSRTKTGRTDAFIIAFTKLEKQARRIFTYMVYQFPEFNVGHCQEILAIIASKRFLYFENFIKGFDELYRLSFEDIVGKAAYQQFLTTDFPRIKKMRNKILHGQPTGQNLSATDLKSEIDVMQRWCLHVAKLMSKEIGFDGLEWNSFRKNHEKNLASTYKIRIADLQMLDDFIESKMK